MVSVAFKFDCEGVCLPCAGCVPADCPDGDAEVNLDVHVAGEVVKARRPYGGSRLSTRDIRARLATMMA